MVVNKIMEKPSPQHALAVTQNRVMVTALDYELKMLCCSAIVPFICDFRFLVKHSLKFLVCSKEGIIMLCIRVYACYNRHTWLGRQFVLSSFVLEEVAYHGSWACLKIILGAKTEMLWLLFALYPDCSPRVVFTAGYPEDWNNTSPRTRARSFWKS